MSDKAIEFWVRVAAEDAIEYALKDNQGEYRIVASNVQSWFDTLNLVIFDQKLPPFDKIAVKALRKWHAHVEATIFHGSNTLVTILTINNKFPSKKNFIEILAHEMVHLWQVLFAGQSLNVKAMNHGKTFFKWKKKFKKAGIRLQKEYDL